jgi:hypothetical protein
MINVGWESGGPMRLYVTVAVLTFVGSYAAYSGSHMLGAARAIGGSPSSAGATEFVKNLNPFVLLQSDRLRALLNSNAGISRMEPVRSNFDTSGVLRGLRSPRIDPNIGRNVFIAPPPQVRVPHIGTPPPMRFYR